MAASYQAGERTVYYSGGVGSPVKSGSGGSVIYDEIRKNYNSSNLFEDPDFPANSSSIGSVGGDTSAASGHAADSYSWARPHELAKTYGIEKPEFVGSASGQSRFSDSDIQQGGLGDCWYLAALANLARKPELLSFVVPDDNFDGFEDGKYCGAFHFRFFSVVEDKWVDIVVDDQLPSIFNPKQPAFTQIRGTKENRAVFWPALIEKAYAKFYGSYKNIEGGQALQALVDFSAGFGVITSSQEKKYFQGLGMTVSNYEAMKLMLQRSMGEGGFVTLSSYDEAGAQTNGCLDGLTDYGQDGNSGFQFDASRNTISSDQSRSGLGICPSHAYTVVDVQEVTMRDGSPAKFLLKIRNPHATHEWVISLFQYL